MGNVIGGGGGSVPRFEVSSNDYQLAIEASKELEFLLESAFGAEGRGLHEKVSSVQNELPAPTVRALRFVASVRNSLIHDHDVRALPDRAAFLRRFQSAREELQVLIDKKKLDAARSRQGGGASGEAGCVIS